MLRHALLSLEALLLHRHGEVVVQLLFSCDLRVVQRQAVDVRRHAAELDVAAQQQKEKRARHAAGAAARIEHQHLVGLLHGAVASKDGLDERHGALRAPHCYSSCSAVGSGLGTLASVGAAAPASVGAAAPARAVVVRGCIFAALLVLASQPDQQLVLLRKRIVSLLAALQRVFEQLQQLLRGLENVDAAVARLCSGAARLCVALLVVVSAEPRQQRPVELTAMGRGDAAQAVQHQMAAMRLSLRALLRALDALLCLLDRRLGRRQRQMAGHLVVLEHVGDDGHLARLVELQVEPQRVLALLFAQRQREIRRADSLVHEHHLEAARQATRPSNSEHKQLEPRKSKADMRAWTDLASVCVLLYWLLVLGQKLGCGTTSREAGSR